MTLENFKGGRGGGRSGFFRNDKTISDYIISIISSIFYVG